MSWLTKENESVWDGFAGSGTFGCVAKSLSLQYDGFEIDKDTTIAANKRIEEYNQKKRGIKTLLDGW